MMKVFFSWSGERSRLVAEALAAWTRQLLRVEPWLSSDIAKGKRWSPEITAALEETAAGIICLTPENVQSPWVLFEAGALSKTKDAHVCTVLIGVSPSDVEPPLGQFQHTALSRDDLKELALTLNRLLLERGERGANDVDIAALFDALWEPLYTKLTAASSQAPSQTPPVRSDREILEEVLQTVRGLGDQSREVKGDAAIDDSASVRTERAWITVVFTGDVVALKGALQDGWIHNVRRSRILPTDDDAAIVALEQVSPHTSAGARKNMIGSIRTIESLGDVRYLGLTDGEPTEEDMLRAASRRSSGLRIIGDDV